MKDKILKFLKQHSGTPYGKRHLARLMAVSRADYRGFRAGLEQLEKEGKVFRMRGGEYVWTDPGQRRSGRLVLHQKGFGFLEVEKGEDVFVHSRNLKGAIHGDTVEVALFPSPFRSRMEGRVTRILKRGSREFIGTVTQREVGFYLHIEPATPRRGIRVVEPSPVTFSSGD
ncbi:MAG: hypothetical protein ACE5HZ_09430, partial [Fidelibacterota bacterium]